MPLKLENELLRATNEQDIAAVQQLLKDGADPNAGLFGLGIDADTAVSIAIQTGNEKILDLLLQHRPACCMVEELSANREPRAIDRRYSTARMLAYNVAVTVTTRYCLRIFATWALDSPVGTLAFWTSHYHWYIVRSFNSDPESLSALTRRYRNPWRCLDILGDVMVGHQLYQWIDRRFLTFAPVPWNPPGMIYDLLLALPLRLCLDALFVLGRNTLTTLGLIRSPHKMWRGDDPCLTRPGQWASPARRVLESIISSSTVTENMVMKLLHMDLLASKPYAESPVVEELLRVALNRCWVQVATYLLSEGAVIDRDSPDGFSTSRLWPRPASAVGYCFPDYWEHLPSEYFDTNYVKWPYVRSSSSFIELIESSTFQSLAISQSPVNHDICKSMLEILHRHSADPLRTDSSGCDALSHIAKVNCSAGLLQYMALIWKEARDGIRGTNDAEWPQSQALHQVTYVNIPDLTRLQILLDAGVSPEWEDNRGRTPLFDAAYMNHAADAIEVLFRAGANPDNGGSKGYPPILRTLDDASLEKFRLFLDHGANPNAVDKKGRSVLERVVQHYTLAVIRSQAVSLLEQGAMVYDAMTYTAPALIAAARRSNIEGWDELLFRDLVANIPQIYRQQQLDMALEAARDTTRAALFKDPFTVFLLLSLGANPKAIKGGVSGLIQFVCYCRPRGHHDYKDDFIDLILRGDVDLNLKDSEGRSPLHYTVDNGSRDFTVLLLQYSAQPDILDDDGYTALQKLCSMDPPKTSIATNFDEVEEDEDPRNAGVRGHAVWRHERRQKHMDIERNLKDEEIFQALVDHSADLTVLDSQERSLLMLASGKGNAVLVANILYRLGEESFGEAVHAADRDGKTALHFAATAGDIDTLKILLFPHYIMTKDPNAWRQLAVNGEHDYQVKNSGGRNARLKEVLEEQVNHYARNLATVPSFLVSSTAEMRHWDVEFTVGSEKRMEEDNICLPNVSTSTWKLHTKDSVSLCGERWRDGVGRTPLHYAAEKGHIEAVKLFLEYTDVGIDVEDHDGKKAIDLALGQKFYNVYAAITTQLGE